MKFVNEKKSSLCIYTNNILPNCDEKMEAALKKELEATKSALKLQTIRCRQLVAAFTRKLQEKEMELRASKDLRDQQLSRLLRALLILESRLKKEQKYIRQQLEEKDLIIERQEREISKLKRSESNWIRQESDSEINRVNELNEQCHNRNNQRECSKPPTGEERLDNLCRGITDLSFKTDIIDFTEVRDLNLDKEKNNKISFVENITQGSELGSKKDFKDNPVLESVNQILLKDEEDLLKSVKTVSINDPEKIASQIVSNGGSEWYETDNSLVVTEERSETGAWCISVVEEDIEREVNPETKNKMIWPVDKNSSPTKSQHLEEKACLEMSKKNLTIAQHEDLEEIDSVISDRAVSPCKSEASYQEITPVYKSNHQPVRNLQKPPALPPKPPRLLKPCQILTNGDSRHLHAVQKDSSENQKDQLKIKLSPIEPKRNNVVPVNTRHRHPTPMVRSISKEKLADAKGKIHVQEMKRNEMNGHIPGNVKPQECFDPNFTIKKEETSPNAIRIGSTVSSLITGSSRDSIVTELNTDQSNDSHVSQLVRQFEVLGKPMTPEPDKTDGDDDSNDLRKNFEEFKLEESYVEISEDVGRHDGDGAETKNVINHYATLSIIPPPLPKDPPPALTTEINNKMYETFLETTGLSQKSILTPSRMLSNHRSCLKPKDVKHRSRIKAAAVIEKCNNVSNIGGPTVKYWTEPYL